MAPADVVNQIISEASVYLTYLLPVIGIMGAIMFVVSFLYYAVTRLAERTFS